MRIGLWAPPPDHLQSSPRLAVARSAGCPLPRAPPRCPPRTIALNIALTLPVARPLTTTLTSSATASKTHAQTLPAASAHGAAPEPTSTPPDRSDDRSISAQEFGDHAHTATCKRTRTYLLCWSRWSPGAPDQLDGARKTSSRRRRPRARRSQLGATMPSLGAPPSGPNSRVFTPTRCAKTEKSFYVPRRRWSAACAGKASATTKKRRDSNRFSPIQATHDSTVSRRCITSADGKGHDHSEERVRCSTGRAAETPPRRFAVEELLRRLPVSLMCKPLTVPLLLPFSWMDDVATGLCTRN